MPGCMFEWTVDGFPRPRVIDKSHPGDGQPAKDIQRYQPTRCSGSLMLAGQSVHPLSLLFEFRVSSFELIVRGGRIHEATLNDTKKRRLDETRQTAPENCFVFLRVV